jgi:PAS domain S-box-containing protein
MATALVGGFGAGVFCVLLSGAAAWFFIVPQRFSFHIDDPAQAVALLLFALVALFTVIFAARMRFAIQREQAAQAIQASKDRLQFTLDMAKLGSWQYDPRRRVLMGDTRFKEIFDVATDEMLIEDLKKLVHPDDAERFWVDREASIDLADPMRSPSHEYRVQRRNGEVRWVEVGWFAYGDRRERGTASVVGTVHDITQRKRTEARLVEREAQLALFVEHAPVGIAMFDNKMRFLAVSRRFLSDRELGDPSDVIGRSVYEIIPDMPPRWREMDVRVLAGEELTEEEDPFLRLDGRTDWCRWLMKPWRTAEGRIGGALLFAEVTTEQVEARRALADSEARFRATFENAAVGIAHADPDGRWLRVNEALCRIVGYPVDELVTKMFQDITHPDDLAAEVAQVELMREGKIDSYDVDKRYLRKDGGIVWGRKTVGCVRKSEGSIDYFVNVVEDITARKRAERGITQERGTVPVLTPPLSIANPLVQ